MTDLHRGLEDRYFVRKQYDPTGKHADCRYFVLDPQHDPIALDALMTYAAEARHKGHEALYRDLMDLVDRIESGADS